jgi:ABC-type Fe3+-siderophore transport system permease subunit
MKRTALALIFNLLLLFSAAAGAQLSLLAKANFVSPPANPHIMITSPINNTSYNVSNLSLEVTFETYKTGYPGGPASNTTRLFTYALDEKEPEPINITNSTVPINPGGDVFFEGSANLTELAEGPHKLTVRVVFVYDNISRGEYIPEGIHTESESTIYFRIETAPSFPTTLVITASGASLAVAGIILVVFFKKRKR